MRHTEGLTDYANIAHLAARAAVRRRWRDRNADRAAHATAIG
jgi:hypothetical protein